MPPNQPHSLETKLDNSENLSSVLNLKKKTNKIHTVYKMEYSSGKGHFANFSLRWGPWQQYFSNYFISNSFESLHNEIPIITAGYLSCGMYINKTFKRWFFTLIHVCVQTNFICYAFESHINVGREGRLASSPGATC